MGFFGSRDRTGIEVGAGSIKVVRVRAGRRPKLLSAAIVETPLAPDPSHSTAADLRFLLSGGRPEEKGVVTLLPSRYLTIRSFLLPKMPGRDLREAVRWEAKRHISYPLEAAQVDFLVTAERRDGALQKCEIVMIAAERSAVRDFLGPFREAGIAVSAVDANPLALRNVLRLRTGLGEGNTVIVDMGAGKTEISIFKGEALRFSRCLETGGLDMTRAIADELAVSLDDAEAAKRRVDLRAPAEADRVAAAVRTRLDMLLLEIRRSIDYYKTTFRETGVERTILTGGVALMQGLRDYVAASLDGEVEVDDPFAATAGTPEVLREVGPQGPRFAAALGLALRQA